MTQPPGESVRFRLVYEGALPPEALGLVGQGDISHLSPADVTAMLGPIATGTSLHMTFETPETNGPLYDEALVSYVSGGKSNQFTPTVTMDGLRVFADRHGYHITAMRSIMNPIERVALPGGVLHQPELASYFVVSPLADNQWQYLGLNVALLPELAQRLNLGDVKIPGLGAERKEILMQLAAELVLPEPADRQ